MGKHLIFIKTIRLVVVTTLTLSISSIALAEQPNSYQNDMNQAGFYVGADAAFYGHGVPDCTVTACASFIDTIDSVGVAGGGTLGYQFNQYIALQTSFYDFDNSSSNGYYINNDFQNAPDHHYLYGGDVSAKFILPISRRFDLYGLTGIGIIHEDTYNMPFENDIYTYNVSNTNVMPKVGGGMEFYFTRHIAATIGVADYIPLGSIKNIFMIPVGLSIHF